VISASACSHSEIPEHKENTINQNDDTNSIEEQNTGIVSEIYTGPVSIKLPDDWDYNETVLIDMEKLECFREKWNRAPYVDE
jgi:hypothetical protein